MTAMVLADCPGGPPRALAPTCGQHEPPNAPPLQQQQTDVTASVTSAAVAQLPRVSRPRLRDRMVAPTLRQMPDTLIWRIALWLDGSSLARLEVSLIVFKHLPSFLWFRMSVPSGESDGARHTKLTQR